MTDARSDTGDKGAGRTDDGGSPIDALNRTIEALEKRLEELASAKAAKTDPDRAWPPRTEPVAASEEQTARIRDRQRRLDAFRAHAARTRQEAAERDVAAQAGAGIGKGSMADGDPDQSDLREVAAALVALRRELRGEIRQDFAQDMARHLGALRAEIVQMKAVGERDTLPEEIQAELVHIGRQIETMAENGSGAQADALKADISALKEAMALLASDEGLSTLQGKVDALADPMVRIDAGMDALAERIDGLPASLAASLAPELENLSARLEKLGGGPGHDETAQRLDALVTQVGQIADLLNPESAAEIADQLNAISGRLDALETALSTAATRMPLADDGLVAKLEALVERAESQQASTAHLSGLQSLQRQLEEITDRLDQSQPATSDMAMRGLEDQISGLARLINERVSGGDTSVMEPRLAAIEDYLAHAQEDVIDAASRAAERAVAAFIESGADDLEGAPDEMAAISGLSQDLRSLHDMTRKSEERHARTFEAVHDTLLKIAERMENLDRGRSATPAAAPATSMASAAAVASGLTGAHDEERSAERTRLDDAPPLAAEPDEEAVSSIDWEGETALLSSPEKPEKKSLLGRLTGRGKDKKTKAAASTATAGGSDGATEGPRDPDADERAPRETVDPAPPIDPSDALSVTAENEPLEPGSGTPDIGQILHRVRQQQQGKADDQYGEANRSDFIAAARRAAQAAAADAETTSRKNAKSKSRNAGAERGSAKSRPLLLAAGAVLLAVMSYPLAANFLAGDDAAPVVSEAETDLGTQPGTTPVTDEIAVTEAGRGESAPAAGREETAAGSTTGDGEGIRQAAAPAADRTTVTSSLTRDSNAGVPQDVAGSDSSSIPADIQTTDEAGPAADEAELGAAAEERLAAVSEAIGSPALIAAARNGDTAALFEIGARYNEGRGVDADSEMAAVWYREAAERGFAPAQYRLANLYEKGRGVARDYEAALDWYRRSADAGNVSAMHNLAVLHASGGADGEPDFDKAARWFEAAAERGVRDSQYNLAVLYARGSGVEQDLAQSYKWFAVAAEGGDTDAAAKRDEVAGAMDDETLQRARAQADLFAPQPVDPSANEVDVPAEWGATDPTNTASVDMTGTVRDVQTLLNARGYDAGDADGIIGATTVEAIKTFQKAAGLEPTGRIDEPFIRALLAESGKS